MADRQDFATAVGALIKGRSPVGHTHDDRYYTESEVNVRGTVPIGANLNDYRTPDHSGRWLLAQSRLAGYVNLPEGIAYEAVLEVESASVNIAVQRVTGRYQEFTFSRTYQSASQEAVFTRWKPLDYSRGRLPANADLNAWREPHHVGLWELDSTRMSGYLNLPPGVTAGGTFEVLAPSGSSVVQRVTERGQSVTVQRVIVSPTTGSFTAWSPMSAPDLSGYVTDQELQDALADIDTGGGTGEILVRGDYTGATDMTATVQAAIDSASVAGVGVRLGYGTLRLEAALIPVTGTQIRGMGIGKTILRPQGTANAIERHAEISDPSIDDVVFEDFEVDGTDQVMPSGGYTATMTKGIFIEKMRRITMRNLHIHDTGATGLGIDHVTGVIENVWAVRCGRLNDGTGPGGSGIGIGTGWLDEHYEPLTISNCHTEGCGRFGIFVESQTGGIYPSGITITGCTARGNKDGIGDAGTRGTIITGCHVYGNTRSGIAVDNGTFSAARPGIGTQIVHNDVTGNGVGVMLYGALDGALDQTLVSGNNIQDNTGNGVELLVNPRTISDLARYVKVADNDIHGNGKNGVALTRLTGTVTLNPLDGLWITRNRLWNNGGAAPDNCGIRIAVDTRNLLIDQNICWDDQATPTQTRAIAMGAAHTGFIERDNLWRTGTVTLAT